MKAKTKREVMALEVRPSVWGCGQGGELPERLEVGYLTYFLHLDPSRISLPTKYYIKYREMRSHDISEVFQLSWILASHHQTNIPQFVAFYPVVSYNYQCFLA